MVRDVVNNHYRAHVDRPTLRKNSNFTTPNKRTSKRRIESRLLESRTEVTEMHPSLNINGGVRQVGKSIHKSRGRLAGSVWIIARQPTHIHHGRLILRVRVVSQVRVEGHVYITTV